MYLFVEAQSLYPLGCSLEPSHPVVVSGESALGRILEAIKRAARREVCYEDNRTEQHCGGREWMSCTVYRCQSGVDRCGKDGRSLGDLVSGWRRLACLTDGGTIPAGSLWIDAEKEHGLLRTSHHWRFSRGSFDLWKLTLVKSDLLSLSSYAESLLGISAGEVVRSSTISGVCVCMFCEALTRPRQQQERCSSHRQRQRQQQGGRPSSRPQERIQQHQHQRCSRRLMNHHRRQQHH
ncbi:hypothetical protein AUEXF2481DRAFT_370973 [Aureobasidium subglaciale EXF-2481]|uniref:Uncharacterized protein n=1 Tax=Aureobasidium subglaciale (strain EXF-2481) TaxID=1043005 RepID=A0A074YLY8_AURSE|nr:uncharacterized protein AUEXF2481DRAFT_370973 [Aureobasidium subglaciale EXF-2481]KEQ98690.1 hypothetical protein AUEXF2481DRAFT_370973 [Aureobasidium subglaciale EXF-2481]